MMGLRTKRVATGAVLAVGVVALTWIFRAPPADGSESTDASGADEVVAHVGVATLRVESVAQERTLLGEARMPTSATSVVTAPMDGRVTRVLVDADAVLSAGTPLVELAARTDALAELSLARAEAEAADARLDAVSDMFDHQLVTVDVLEAARSEARTAHAAREAAARTRAASTFAVAADGRVHIRELVAAPGDWVAAGDVLLVVDDPSRLEGVFGVEPVDADAAGRAAFRVRRPGDAADEAAPALRAERIGWSVDPLSRLSTAYLQLGADAGYRPGELLVATMAFDVTPGVVVPFDAIVVREDGEVVFVLDGDRVRAVPITGGYEVDAGRVLDPSSLADGARVVVRGASALEDGMRVEVSP